MATRKFTIVFLSIACLMSSYASTAHAGFQITNNVKGTIVMDGSSSVVIDGHDTIIIDGHDTLS